MSTPKLVKQEKKSTLKEINDKLAASKKKGDPDVTITDIADEPVMVNGELPGMETEKIPELIRAGKLYNKAKKERMAILEVEVERKAALTELMHQHNLTHYRWGKLTIDLESTEKLKVKEDDDEE